MPGISFDEPLFAANAGVASDWGSAKGTALVQLPVDLQLNRGASLELGLVGMIRGEAEFQKFVAAQITGQVGAQARIQGQIQMPVNLFHEVGFAVRLKAIAEAAVGIEAGLGIRIGDFLQLAESSLQLNGLPLELFMIFMEEIDLGASLSAKAAFTAQAYANLVCSGRLVGDATTEPGFDVSFGYGYGWKGGYGFRMTARAGIKDVSRLVARSTDATVDNVVDRLLLTLKDDQSVERALLMASRPVAKIAIRVAYEAGEYLATNSSPFNSDGAQQVALRVTQVVLEECQRAMLKELIEDALRRFEEWLEDEITTLDGGVFASLRPEREALAAHLRNVPNNAFDLRDSSAMDYWNTLSILMGNFAVSLSQATTPLTDAQKTLMAQLWAATQLMFAATRRMVRADASVSVIGLPPAQAKASFEGPLPSQPHQIIREIIAERVKDATGSAPVGDLTQEDLLTFLLEAGLLAAISNSSPGIAAFLEPFEGSGLGATKADVARLMMTSMGSVMTNGAGELDAQLSLQELANGLRLFVHDKFEDIVVPAAHAAVHAHQTDLLTYLDEVILPSMSMVIDTGFTDILGWANGTVSQAALEEALSSVLMSIIGRSLIVTGDILMVYAQDNFADMLERMAALPGALDDPNALLQLPGGFCEAAGGLLDHALPMTETEIAEEMRVFLTLASEVARPFPPEVRARIRQLMFDVIAPLPANASDDFLQDLKNDLWIPNDGALIELGQEMMGQVGAQLSDFVLRLLAHMVEVADEALDDALTQLAEMFRSFAVGLANALALAAERLAEIAGDLVKLLSDLAESISEIAEAVQDFALSALARVDDLAAEVIDGLMIKALPLLSSDLTYDTVPPEWRNALEETMRGAISAQVQSPVIAPLEAALTALSDQTQPLIDDLMALDPNTGLATGLREVVLDRLRAVLPPQNLLIPVKFDFSWTVTVQIFDFFKGKLVNQQITTSVSFDLGHVVLNTGPLSALVEDVLLAGDDVVSALNTLAALLQSHASIVLGITLLEEEQTALTQESAKANVQMAKINTDAPTGIEILSPAQAGVARFPLEIRLWVHGASPALLVPIIGVPPRLTVFLNDDMIPLSGLLVVPPPPNARLVGGVEVALREPSVKALEGVNTLIVAVVDANGVERRASHAFVIDAPAIGRKPPPKDKPIPYIERPGAKKKPARRPLLGVGATAKKKMAAKAKRQMPKPPEDPVRAMAKGSAILARSAARRFNDRSYCPAKGPRIVSTPIKKKGRKA